MTGMTDNAFDIGAQTLYLVPYEFIWFYQVQ